MSKNAYIVLFLLFSVQVSSNDISIEIDISEQRLYLIQNNSIQSSYPVSTSKYGEGSIQNSFKTPLGHHIVKEKIGEGALINTIFKSRINTRRSAEIIEEYEDSDDDFVTSRIMWLDGQEEGMNKGGMVDSYKRYIYIHGTHEEGLIGSKASHGCVRMFNTDAIELFDIVKIGTKVLIKA